MVILMVYDVITKICREEKMEHEPFYKSIKIKGDTILLYREKVVKESIAYKHYKEWKKAKDEDKQEEIDDVIEKLREYFKERLIVFYKSNEITV
jgi:hypothetical protein